MSKFTYIDLFSGIGGFRVAIDALGGKSVGFSEIDKKALETYKANFEDPVDHDLGDITKIKTLPKVDLLVGGVPCQSWSVAGKMKGFEDPRGALWFDTIKMVEKSKPKVFIFENVKGLADPRNSDNLSLLINSFKKLGYLVDHKLLNAFDYGVPQNRSRIFIIGFQNKFRKEFSNFSFPTNRHTTLQISKFLDNVEHKKVSKEKMTADELFDGKVPVSRNKFQKDDELNDFFVLCDTRNGHTTIHSWDIRPTSTIQKEICMTILKNRRKKQYGDFDGNPMSFKDIKKLYSKTNKKDIDDLVRKKILKYNKDGLIDLVHSKNSAGIDDIYRVYLPNSEIFSTLTATGTKDFIAEEYVSGNTVVEYKQNFVNNILKKKKLRQISPKEASLIQGFPRKFTLHPENKFAHKQVGNSVAPPVVKALMANIIETKVI